MQSVGSIFNLLDCYLLWKGVLCVVFCFVFSFQFLYGSTFFFLQGCTFFFKVAFYNWLVNKQGS